MALYNYIIASGVIVEDTSGILTDVQTEYLDTFGQDLNVNPETPQGILINAETLARAAVAGNNVALANQINPNIAGGVFLDAICALTGLQRTPASYSIVGAVVTGVPSTIIPTSATAALTTGELFSPVSEITIASTGTGTGTFQALVSGPTAVPIGSLSAIANGVLGWEGINNTTVGTPGAATQTDAALRRLRQQTLALQGTALPEAITSALMGNEIGVTSLTFRENIAPTTETIDGVTMGSHSIYVCMTNNQPLEYVQVVATVTGTAGTVIPVTAIAADTSSNQYSPVQPLIIQANGTGIGVFQALVAGATNTASGTLTTIVTAITGWSTVTNTYASTIYDYEFLQNVAFQLLSTKSSGSAWNLGPGTAPYGGQNIVVTDPVSLQGYIVQFGTPTPIPILMQVTVFVTNAFTGDPVAAVQNAILDYVENGNTQDPGFIIGADVSVFELSSAVNLALSGIFISNFEITLASDVDFSNATIDINIWEQATVQQSSIQVLVTYPAGFSISR